MNRYSRRAKKEWRVHDDVLREVRDIATRRAGKSFSKKAGKEFARGAGNTVLRVAGIDITRKVGRGVLIRAWNDITRVVRNVASRTTRTRSAEQEW